MLSAGKMTEIGIYDALLIPFIVGLLEQISIWNIWKNSGAKIMMLVCLPHSIDVFHTVIEYCQLAVGKWREQKSQNKTSSMRKSLQYFELWWIERLGHCINVFFFCVCKRCAFWFHLWKSNHSLCVEFSGEFCRYVSSHCSTLHSSNGNHWKQLDIVCVYFHFKFRSSFVAYAL